jgi:hypothetical protein
MVPAPSARRVTVAKASETKKSYPAALVALVAKAKKEGTASCEAINGVRYTVTHSKDGFGVVIAQVGGWPQYHYAPNNFPKDFSVEDLISRDSEQHGGLVLEQPGT